MSLGESEHLQVHESSYHLREMTLTGELKLGATKCDEEITIPLPLNDSGSAKGLGSIPSQLSNDLGSAKGLGIYSFSTFK